MPLTLNQREIWTAEAQNPGDPQFNIVLHERLTGPVDTEGLRTSLTRVLRRHEAFSVRFGEDEGVPYQWIERRDECSWVDQVDLSDGPEPAVAFETWRDRLIAEPFVPTGSRLFTALLLRESDEVVHLLLKAHHLIVDGWSLNLVSTEMWTEYALLTNGRRQPSPDPGTAYADTAYAGTAYADTVAADADYQKSEDHERDLVHHGAALTRASPALFPRSTPPAGPRSTRYDRRPPSGRYTFTLDAALVKRLRKGGSSPFAYLAAAFATYAARIHRTDGIVLGMPFLNRRTAAERGVVAQLANNLPLPVAIRPGATLHELAAEIGTTIEETRPHQRLTLGDLVRSLPAPPGGGPSRQPFDITLTYLRFPRAPVPPGIGRDLLMFAARHPQDALYVVVQAPEDDSDLRIDLEYAGDVFDADLPIAAVARQVRALLVSGLDMPDRPATALPLLDSTARAQLIRQAQGPAVPYPADRTVHALIEEQAARTPDRIAVIHGSGRRLTYAELDARANQVARALRARGIRPDDRVAVLSERGPESLVALLGVLKSGGAYVPVDPGYPADRIAFMLRDSRAAAVLMDAGTPRPEVDTAIPVLRVAELLHGPRGPLEPAATSRDLAYVIYTSGSTGRPKGVMVEHHSVVNRLAWMQRRYPVGEGDVLLHKTPISFDVSVWELFWWAIEGATVALLPPGGEKDPRTILRTVRDQRVSVLHFVPSMLGPFLDLLSDDAGARADAASLRHVFCSGEALPPARVEQFNHVFASGSGPGPRLVNLYGPTEATVDVSYHDCPSDPGMPVTRVPIGRPIDNTALYVLDGHDRPQPPGVPGELCVGGVGVARGYLGRPELTAEKFVRDPFGTRGLAGAHGPSGTGNRLYRTGDLARRLADGTLEYLGRIDGQVKIRGNRVELGEVERALAAAPGVRDAVVVDQRSASRGTYLTGCYVANAELEPGELRVHLASRLPDFMIPANFVRIDAVPLTPNGKADRRALLSLPAAGTGPRGKTPPRDAAERTLARIWGELLEAGDIGVYDDYFALGGDSLLMLRVQAAAAKEGLLFSLTDLTRNPTVAGLAAVATSGRKPSDGAADEPFALVSRVDRARLEGYEDAYPLSRLQLGLLYHSRAQERTAVYHDVFRYSFEMPWNEALFTRAFDRLVARHPALRSSFDLGGFSEPLQLVAPHVSGGLAVHDLRGAGGDTEPAEIARHIEERRFHRYDFLRAPLYHFRLYVLPDTVEMVLSFHHALLDGGSVANLVRELLQDYLSTMGLDTGPVADHKLPSPAGHVAAERAALASASTRTYWRDRLEGASPPRPTAFRPHEAPRGDELITRRESLSADLTHAIRDFARRHAVPVKSVLFAAHCLTLSRFSGTEDITTGLITHGRPETEGAERIAGLFLNTLPIRLNTARDSGLDVVREAFSQEQQSHAHRRYPLSAIQEDLGGTVLDTAFNYVHFRQLAEVFALPGVRLRSFLTWEETNFTLLVNALTDPADGRLWLRLDYQGSVFTPSQAELYTDTFTGLLSRLLHHPDEAPGCGLPASPPVLAERAETTPTDVVRAIREQTTRTPDAIALGFGEQRWTYAELGRASDRVARRLLALGAAPGESVGIAMDRSPETVAVLLGVLKAGAAALPLDTAYPPERLGAMLEQARPFRVIAQPAYHQLVSGAAATLTPEEVLDGSGGGPGTDAPPVPAIAPEHTAYVLFTSGSSGRPKGVAMPHRSLARLIAWQNGAPSGVPGGITAQYAPMSFDVSFQEIFSTLCGGGTLVLLSEAERRDMPALLRLLERERVQRLYLPYVALQQLAEASAALGLVPGALRALISSGEQLRVTPEIRRLCAGLPGALLENQYGPTESHVVTSHTLSGDPDHWPSLPPIGTPVDGAEVLILDSRMRPVPAGVTGEIHLGGACLADGYLNQSALTGERFVPHPSGGPGRRLYRTGDLGFALADGAMVCTGRADTQVKVRGFRVEPAEVELAIARFASSHHPGLAETAVVARRREGDDTFLAAFLVGDREHTDTAQLGKQLRAVLPEYMVPSHFEWLPALPLTPSGKRDDAALRRLPLTVGTTGATGGAAPPRDGYERALVEIVGELLQRPAVGVHDNIFDLGATSLTAMRLVVLIEQRYGTGLPLSELISAPTMAQLAERLRSRGASAAFDPLVPIRTGGSRPPLFLVHPMGGNVLCYVRFARYLPADQPLYALQAAGVDPGTEPLRGGVEEIAAGYVAAIRRLRPRGPYTIGGWSFGGFVAFEMARQIRAAGEEVAHLVLLDTTALAPGRRLPVRSDALLTWFFWELLWLRRGGDSPQEVLPAGLTTLAEQFDFIAALAVAEGVLPAGSSGAVVRRLFHVYETNWRAAYAYRPGTVHQDMTLIHAAEPLPDVLESMHETIGSMHRDPANGWRERTSGELTVIDVPGDHLTIMEEPHVIRVARTVGELIAPPRGAGPGSTPQQRHTDDSDLRGE
ncbi:amino acid adenylation domain-containing protein [Streptomyces sp. NPDC007983]|uniref:amino acid adenylation domain-containing protein n=1 Tax=Streptomyces sp. NPDC007983 TaxID=3364800 RepID=UPI0036EF53F9